MKNKIAVVSDKRFLESYNLSNCLTQYKGLTIAKCIESNSPTIATIQKAKGEEFTYAFVCQWLFNLNDILALKNPMNDTQIKLCSQYILDEFYGLKIADLTLVSKRILSGLYGEFYERISITKIMTIIREYDDERKDWSANQSIRQHYENKKQ